MSVLVIGVHRSPEVRLWKGRPINLNPVEFASLHFVMKHLSIGSVKETFSVRSELYMFFFNKVV